MSEQRPGYDESADGEPGSEQRELNLIADRRDWEINPYEWGRVANLAAERAAYRHQRRSVLGQCTQLLEANTVEPLVREETTSVDLGHSPDTGALGEASMIVYPNHLVLTVDQGRSVFIDLTPEEVQAWQATIDRETPDPLTHGASLGSPEERTVAANQIFLDRLTQLRAKLATDLPSGQPVDSPAVTAARDQLTAELDQAEAALTAKRDTAQTTLDSVRNLITELERASATVEDYGWAPRVIQDQTRTAVVAWNNGRLDQARTLAQQTFEAIEAHERKRVEQAISELHCPLCGSPFERGECPTRHEVGFGEQAGPIDWRLSEQYYYGYRDRLDTALVKLMTPKPNERCVAEIFAVAPRSGDLSFNVQSDTYPHHASSQSDFWWDGEPFNGDLWIDDTHRTLKPWVDPAKPA